MCDASGAWNNRVLVVDDDEQMHGLLRRVLRLPASRAPSAAAGRFEEPASFQLNFAFQGMEAFQMVQAAGAAGNPYALVFMDMEMPPGLDGIDTIERIRQIDSDVEIVVCSGHWHERREQRLRSVAGAEEIPVIDKPFHNSQVHELVCRLVTKWNRAHSSCSMVGPT